jgi:hypothetical protein
MKGTAVRRERTHSKGRGTSPKKEKVNNLERER